MKKVPGVAQVHVSLNEGLTILDLKPENTVTMAQLRLIIKNNGFVSKDARVVARGAVSSDQKTFTVSGTNERLSLTSPPRSRGEEWDVNAGPPEKP